MNNGQCISSHTELSKVYVQEAVSDGMLGHAGLHVLAPIDISYGFREVPLEVAIQDQM